jgi:hypothetical protein
LRSWPGKQGKSSRWLAAGYQYIKQKRRRHAQGIIGSLDRNTWRWRRNALRVRTVGGEGTQYSTVVRAAVARGGEEDHAARVWGVIVDK